MLISYPLLNTMEDFFYCTHIPIRFFRSDGTLIHSVGYSEDLDTVFSKNEIFKELKNKVTMQEDDNFVTITCCNNIKFSACKTCQCNANKDIFILGPYMSDKTENSNLVYKPSHCIPLIISLLCNIQKDIAFLKSKKYTCNRNYSFYITKAIDYINSNFHNPISLNDISRYLSINKCYFCSMFKDEVGKTFSQYLNNLRVEKSKEMLSNKNMNLLDIALSVGFNNQNYFSMTFKKITGKTPLQFRNNISGKTS